MNIQKINIFNRTIIIKKIEQCQKDNIDIKDISIIGYQLDSIEFCILCNKKLKKKCFPSVEMIEVQTIDYGRCKCHIFSYEEALKELIHNNEYYWSIIRSSQVLLDLSNNYKIMIRSAECKSNWWPIFKKIFY